MITYIDLIFAGINLTTNALILFEQAPENRKAKNVANYTKRETDSDSTTMLIR